VVATHGLTTVTSRIRERETMIQETWRPCVSWCIVARPLYLSRGGGGGAAAAAGGALTWRCFHIRCSRWKPPNLIQWLTSSAAVAFHLPCD